MPTYRRYVPAAPEVRDLRRQGGNDDARRRAERAGDVEVKPIAPEPTREPELTAPDIAPEASPAAEQPKRGRSRKDATK